MRALIILVISTLLGCVGYNVNNLNKGSALHSFAVIPGARTVVHNYGIHLSKIVMSEPLAATTNIFTVLENVFLEFGANGLRSFIGHAKEMNLINDSYLQENFVQAWDDADNEYLSILLSLGANVNIANENNNTALWYALTKQLKNRFEFLIEAGASIDTPFHICGMRPIQKAVYSNWRDGVALLINYHADMDFTVDKGMNLVDIACTYASVQVLQLLVEDGVDYKKTDNKGQTPYMHAAANNNLEHMIYLALLGVDVDACDKEGFHAVHHAAMLGKKRVLQYIYSISPTVLKKKLYVPNWDKYVTPLEIAAHQYYPDLLLKFLHWGCLDEYDAILDILKSKDKADIIIRFTEEYKKINQELVAN